MKSAASLTALTSCPLAKPGCMLTPVKRTVASSAEKVSSWISPAVEPSRVNAAAAPNASRSKNFVPSPTSSSGVKAIRSGPCGSSGCATRYSTAAMISATPALSSAPSSVVPSVVTRSWPTWRAQLRELGGVEREVRIGGKRDPAAVVARDELRLHVRAADRRARVDVRDQAEHRHLVGTVAGRVAVA